MTDTARAGGPTSEHAGATVELVGLRRRFGATQALDGFTISLEPGELVALLGPSGCGKTTALRALAGFETVDSGRVVVDGVDQARIPAQKRDMGMVFQSYSLFPNMTAQDNVGFGLRMRKVGTGARRQRALEMLELVGLEGQAAKYPHEMSGGQQQRVALARALAIEPRVLLLDEPLSALDAKVRVQLRREQIRVLQTRLKITTLFVTHDQEEALSMADRVCVMRAGRIEQVDTPATLYASPATPFVAEFVGTMNRIPGIIDGDRVTLLGTTVDLRTAAEAPRGQHAAGTAVDVLVRPEGLTVSASPHARSIVMTTTFLGSVTRLGVLLDEDLMVYVDQPNSAVQVPVGSAVEVTLTERAVMVADRTGPPADQTDTAPSLVSQPASSPSPPLHP